MELGTTTRERTKKMPEAEDIVGDQDIEIVGESKVCVGNIIPFMLLTDSNPFSQILEMSDIRLLSDKLPSVLCGCGWQIVYSTDKHGYSLSNVYRWVKSKAESQFKEGLS